MQINEFDDISVNGQFDSILQENCSSHGLITWRLMKSIAFNESNLHPYVENGLFRTPNRIFREFEGEDPYNPTDAILTAYRIICNLWDNFGILCDEDRLLFTILAYKLRQFNTKILLSISLSFKDLYSKFSIKVLHEVVKIKEYAEVF